MPNSVCALITTTEKNKILFEQLIVSLSRQSLPPRRVTVIYDGALRPEKRSFDSCPLPISWIDRKPGVSLTYLQNQAIKFSDEEFLLLLNDDVVLEKDFIECLLKAAEPRDVGMSCGKLLRMDRHTIDSAGLFLGRARNPRDRGYNLEDHGQFETPEFVFGACGAAVLYRREMLEDAAISAGEYFDADYNMFYEDLDISWRSRNLGWKAFYSPEARAYHCRGATAKSRQPGIALLRAYNFAWLSTQLKAGLIKNRVMTIIKNDSWRGFIFNFPHIFFYDLKLFFYCLIFDPQVIGITLTNFRYFMLAFKKRKQLREKIKERSGVMRAEHP